MVADVVTLATAAPGRPVRLGEPDPVVVPPARVRRLAEMGLRQGAVVEILQRTAGGGRIVAVGDGRVALDRTMLRAIPVEALPVEALPLDGSGSE